MAKRSLHRGPNGCIGKQNNSSTNMGTLSDIIHKQVARKKAILSNYSEAIQIQGSSTPSTGDGGSRGIGTNTGSAVHNAVGAACQANHRDGRANKSNMEAMMTRVNALVTAAGGTALPTTATTPPASGNPLTVVPKEKKVKSKELCPLCKKMVLHKQKN